MERVDGKSEYQVFAQTHSPYPIKRLTRTLTRTQTCRKERREKGENENVDKFSSTDFFWFIFVTSMETEIYNENIWEYRFE